MKKIFLKSMVIVMLMVLMLGMSMIFVGCEDYANKVYEITLHPIHPITGEERSEAYMTIDSETLYGDREFVEIKFKEKGKKKFLPNKYISLNELKHLVNMYVYIDDSKDRKPIMSHGSIKYPENIPKEKGDYSIVVEFNNYTYDTNGDMMRLSTKFESEIKTFGLVIV